MDILGKIRKLRIRKKITQKDMGSFLSVSKETYRNIENGKIRLKFDDYLKICECLGVPPSFFLTSLDDNLHLVTDEEMKNIKQIISLAESLNFGPSFELLPKNKDDYSLRLSDSSKKEKK